MNTELKYRTFDQLVSDVSSDLHVLDNEGLVQSGQLIKIARKVNKELGLVINTTKEKILEIEHNKAKLPDDFYVLNLALLCDRSRLYNPPLPSGTHREDVVVPWPVLQPSDCPCLNVINSTPSIAQAVVTYCDGTQGSIVVPPGTNMTLCVRSVTSYPPITVTPTGGYCYFINGQYTCTPPPPNCEIPEFTICNPDPDPMMQRSVYSTCCGSNIQVVEHRKHCGEVHVYERFDKIHIEKSSLVDTACMNTRIRSRNIGELKNGHLYTSVCTGKLFISYQGMLEDENGNLLVLDHEIINEFYEYALKERILENLYFNGEDVLQKLQLAQVKLKTARTEALSIANTPDFHDLFRMWKMNREYKYKRYFKPFEPLLIDAFGVN